MFPSFFIASFAKKYLNAENLHYMSLEEQEYQFDRANKVVKADTISYKFKVLGEKSYYGVLSQ